MPKMTLAEQKRFLTEYFEFNDKIKKLIKILEAKKKILKEIKFKWVKKDSKNDICNLGVHTVTKNKRVKAKSDEEVQNILEIEGLWDSLKKTVEVLDEEQLATDVAAEKVSEKVLDSLVNETFAFSVTETDAKKKVSKRR